MKAFVMGAAFAAVIAIGSVAVGQAMHGGSMGQSMPMHGGWPPGQSWPMGPRWQGQGPMPRHHIAMMWGVPEPYRSMTNPLPRTQATLERGATVYAQNCEGCHGAQGLGDGEAGAGLSPPPGNLAWLSDMPMGQWDSFVYWTVAEGGSQFGTAMPAFKDSLSKDEIWAVSAYIQAHLPPENTK